MTPREVELWLPGVAYADVAAIAEAADVSRKYWMAQGMNSAQLAEAMEAACEVQCIAAMFPAKPDAALRPGKMSNVYRVARLHFRNAVEKLPFYKAREV